MRHRFILLFALVGLALLPSCAYTVDQDKAPLQGFAWKPLTPIPGGSWSGVALTSAEATAVLDIVNTASLSQLDNEIGLTSTAAQNIVSARAIKTLGDLDRVPYVGPSALTTLKKYVPEWIGSPAEGSSVSQSGVTFTSTEVSVVLEMANRATFDQLDKEVGLTSTAARSIVAARPIATLVELDQVKYVGGSALKALRALVPMWKPVGGGATGGTEYDGIAFDAAEEGTALVIVNRASDGQLKAGGVTTTPRRILIANRPWASLAAVAAFKGIGAATMRALRTMVATWQGTTTAPPALAVSTLTAAAATAGAASQYYDRVVVVPRAIITSTPSKSSTGKAVFYIADPAAGDVQQLKVYVSPSARLQIAFATIYDDIRIQGRFTKYRDEFELLLDLPDKHSLKLNRSGLTYRCYKAIQAAWRSTAANPEGAVRVSSTSGYVFMIPLPLFKHHPMWAGSPPSSPRSSGNEQDLAWNGAAQSKLNAWRLANGY